MQSSTSRERERVADRRAPGSKNPGARPFFCPDNGLSDADFRRPGPGDAHCDRPATAAEPPAEPAYHDSEPQTAPEPWSSSARAAPASSCAGQSAPAKLSLLRAVVLPARHPLLHGSWRADFHEPYSRGRYSCTRCAPCGRPRCCTRGYRKSGRRAIAAFVAQAYIPEAVIDSAIETDMHAPVARIETIASAIKSPISRGPQRTI